LRRQSGRSQRAEAVHRRADRADEDVRRSGVDCDRERPAERRRRAAEDGAIALSFAQVVELVSSPDGEGLLAGHRAYISCLFCDLRCFTGFVETSEPEELVEVLHPHQSAAGALIPAYDGTLEHFASDGLMLFFNDPTPVAEHELQAIRLALALQRRFGELTTGWRKRGIDLSLGIGIAAGHATLGRIGFEGRYDYGALGPVTNLASRLST
jgi:class 3 adenylate cyclase